MSESHVERENTRADWVNDKALWVLLVLAGAITPFRFDVTDLLSLGPYPIHLILTIYLGYRMGRWYGAVAGIAMLAPWFYWDTWAIIDTLENIEFFEDLNLSARRVTVDQALVAAAFGWIAGYVTDIAEAILVKNEVYIATYFPRRRTSWLALFGRKVPTLFENWGKDKNEQDESGKPKFTLDSMVTNIRSLGMRINQLAIVPSVLITLNIYITIEMLDADSGFLQFSLIPFGLSAVLLIVTGYITASRIAVFIAFLVWFGSLLALGSEFGLAELFYDVATDIEVPISTIASIVGVSILTWVAVRVSRIQRSGELQASLLKTIAPYCRGSYAPPAASLTVLVPLLLLFFSFDFFFDPDDYFPETADSELAAPVEQVEEEFADDDPFMELEEIIVTAGTIGSSTIYVFIQPWTLIFCALVYLGSAYDARGVSNRFIAFFAVLLFFQFGFELGDAASLNSYAPGTGDFLLLALAPFLGRYLDLSQLRVCRALLAGGWLLSVLFHIYVHGSVDVGVVTISNLVLLSLIIQVGIIELLARLLCKAEISGGFLSLISGGIVAGKAV